MRHCVPLLKLPLDDPSAGISEIEKTKNGNRRDLVLLPETRLPRLPPIHLPPHLDPYLSTPFASSKLLDISLRTLTESAFRDPLESEEDPAYPFFPRTIVIRLYRATVY